MVYKFPIFLKITSPYYSRAHTHQVADMDDVGCFAAWRWELAACPHRVIDGDWHGHFLLTDGAPHHWVIRGHWKKKKKRQIKVRKWFNRTIHQKQGPALNRFLNRWKTPPSWYKLNGTETKIRYHCDRKPINASLTATVKQNLNRC